MIVACGMSVNASTRKLYSQDYENATGADSWTSPNAGASLSLETDDNYGKFIQFAPGLTNDRSASTTWWSSDNDFYGDVTNYTLQFDASITAGNNHFTTELAVMTDGGRIKNNSNYASNNSNGNYILDLTNNTDQTTFSVNGGTAMQLTVGEWLHFNIYVDVAARTAVATITNKSDGSVVANSTLSLPEGTSTRATGIYYLAGRYNNVLKIDNILITTQTEGDVANKPTVTLTGLNGTERTYTIAYDEFETLHYILPEADTATAEGGKPVEVTTSTSGDLKAWTTSGTAVSDTVTVAVDAVPVSVAAPVATLSDINTGYKRAYVVTEDNSAVLLNPQATITAQFVDKSGTIQSESTIASGDTIRTDAEGKFVVTASAEGYEPQTIEIAVDTAYDFKASYPFKQMTREQLVDNDWLEIGEAMTESRWGLTSALNFIVDPSVDGAAENAFPGLTLFTNKVPTIVVGYGLMAPLTDANGTTVSLYGTPLTFTDGKADDYAVITTTDNYGAKTSTTVIPCDQSYSLFRFSSMITDIRIYSPHKSKPVTGINEIVGDEANGGSEAYYTLGGIRVTKPSSPGIYIHNGKKFVDK